MEFLEINDAMKPLLRAFVDYFEYLTVYLDKTKIKVIMDLQYTRGTDFVEIYDINVSEVIKIGRRMK